jgi:hypothetical protein
MPPTEVHLRQQDQPAYEQITLRAIDPALLGRGCVDCMADHLGNIVESYDLQEHHEVEFGVLTSNFSNTCLDGLPFTVNLATTLVLEVF